MALQYYDLVLGGILVSVLTGAVIGTFTALPGVVATVVAYTVAVGLIAHALFVRGPVEGVEGLSKEVERVGPVEIGD